MREIPPSEKGAALLSILLLVAILSVIAATTLDRVIIATKLAGNSQSIRQARWLASSAGDIALARIADLRAADSNQTLAGGWMGQTRNFQLPGGTVSATLNDGGNCFNLNSLVQDNDGKLTANPVAREQLLSLLAALSVPEYQAQPLAAAATDWADSDATALPGGNEGSGASPVANRLFVHKSELRGIGGVSPELYARLAPFVCALPEAVLSPVNVNTLLPEQAPLLAMLYPPRAMPLTEARSLLARRPSGGYGSLVRFWDAMGAGRARPAQVVQDQVKLVSNWFMLDLVIESGESALRERALIAADSGTPRIVWRSWGEGA